MKTVNLAIVMVTVAILSACSKSPSESDAKTAIKNRFGDCAYVSIEDFKKVNGTKVSEQEYLVDVTYKVDKTPMPESKKIGEEYFAKSAEINSKIPTVQNSIQKLNSEFEPEYNSIKNQLSNSTDQAQRQLLQAQLDKITKSYSVEYDSLNSQLTALRNDLDTLKQNILKESGAMAINFSKACPMYGSAANQLSSGFVHTDRYFAGESYSKEIINNFKETLQMVKTDNGWMLAK